MMIAAGINVAQHRYVREPSQGGGNGHEPLGDELFDDALILREAFERFHVTGLRHLSRLGRGHCRRGRREPIHAAPLPQRAGYYS